MEVFARQDGLLCGIDEAKVLLAHVLHEAGETSAVVESLADGDTFAPKEVVMRIRARYRVFGLYETAILGMLAQSTGGPWPPASVSTRRCRSPSSASAPGTSIRTSPIRWTTPPSSAVAWRVDARRCASGGPVADGHHAAFARARLG